MWPLTGPCLLPQFISSGAVSPHVHTFLPGHRWLGVTPPPRAATVLSSLGVFWILPCSWIPAGFRDAGSPRIGAVVLSGSAGSSTGELRSGSGSRPYSIRRQAALCSLPRTELPCPSGPGDPPSPAGRTPPAQCMALSQRPQGSAIAGGEEPAWAPGPSRSPLRQQDPVAPDRDTLQTYSVSDSLPLLAESSRSFANSVAAKGISLVITWGR